jgi:hypothetical protein
MGKLEVIGKRLEVNGSEESLQGPVLGLPRKSDFELNKFGLKDAKMDVSQLSEIDGHFKIVPLDRHTK